MQREYQYNYSELKPSVYNSDKRVRKAETIVRVCQDYVGSADLGKLQLLDVGSSSGIIDNYLADHFGRVTGVDIDAPAMAHAQKSFSKGNLVYEQGDVMQLEYPDNSFDVVVCTQIYEHVPDAQRMFDEIFRVLKPGGFCYFAGNNRVMLMEPHYKLPLLSLLPRAMAHRYMRITGKGEYYHELHFTHWTLVKMCGRFRIHDYTARVVAEPDRFGIGYMLAKGSPKWLLSNVVARYLPWAAPAIWILQKPDPAHA